MYRTSKPKVVAESVSTQASPSSTAEMQTYTNSEFGFSVRYPARFTSSPVPTGNEFTKTVAELSSKYKETIKVDVINNVDIYQNEQVTKVATREVMDAGYKYTVSPTKINQYSAAITNMDVITTKDNLNTQTITVTIQHPKENLYVVLVLPRRFSKVEFEEILASFKFADTSDRVVINYLVNRFYTALESQDGKILFNYFTQPSTPQEISDFTWLTGADLTAGPIYRAFFRQKISNPKIAVVQKVNDSTYVVNISDQIIGIPSAGSETAIFRPRSRKVVLAVVKVDDKWLVDRFTEPSRTSVGSTRTSKYSGFGQ